MLDKLKGFVKENGPKAGRFVKEVVHVAVVYTVAAGTVLALDAGVTALANRIGNRNVVEQGEIAPTEEVVV